VIAFKRGQRFFELLSNGELRTVASVRSHSLVMGTSFAFDEQQNFYLASTFSGQLEVDGLNRSDISCGVVRHYLARFDKSGNFH
jgi:hypothetical protein